MAIIFYYVNSVDSSAVLFHKESKNDIELDLQQIAFWGSKLHINVFFKTEFKENVFIL